MAYRHISGDAYNGNEDEILESGLDLLAIKEIQQKYKPKVRDRIYTTCARDAYRILSEESTLIEHITEVLMTGKAMMFVPIELDGKFKVLEQEWDTYLHEQAAGDQQWWSRVQAGIGTTTTKKSGERHDQRT